MQWGRWIEYGGDPDAFWRQTPLTFAIFMRAKGKAFEHEARSRQWLAWHNAYLGRVDKFPTWADFTDTRTRKSEAELMSMGRLMAAAGFGVFHPAPTDQDPTDRGEEAPSGATSRATSPAVAGEENPQGALSP